MTKKDSLSSDIALVKEFEELKLKQRLLIESLKKKMKSEERELLKEIASKLDFLVKIFTEAQKEEKETNEDPYLKNFQELTQKIEALDSKFEEVLNKKEEEIKKVETTSQKKENYLSKPVSATLQSKPEEPVKKSDSLPPLPDFRVEKGKEAVK